MELRITTNQILKILQILSWIIFIGLCIEAGAIIFNTVYTFAIHPMDTHRFWAGTDLSALYSYDQGQYIVIVLFMTIVSILKAILFYLIIKLFVEKKVTIRQPFNLELRQFLSRVSFLALGIGLFSYSGGEYSAWLSAQKVDMPDQQSLHLGGSDVWLFMAILLFVVTQVVKRGIEIQKENDLTV